MQLSNNKTALAGGLGKNLCSWTERTSEVNHKMHGKFNITQRNAQLISGQNAKLAIIDAALYVAEHTPPGFRSLHRDEIAGERWEMAWGDFIAEVAHMFAGTSLLSNKGAFALGKRLTVCFRDALQRGLEEGWERIRMASLDGVCRHHDGAAPAILVAPKGAAFIWCPADFGKQKRVSLGQLADLCAAQAFGLVRRAA